MSDLVVLLKMPQKYLKDQVYTKRAYNEIDRKKKLLK